MRHSVKMEGLTTKKFVANARREPTYSASIQNNTAQILTVTVTNQDIFDPNAVFSPLPTPLTVAAGDVELLNSPHSGWLLSLPLVGAAGATVDIFEDG
jgi:hypothetical protein